MPNLSVILPVYNETAIIAQVFAELADFARQREDYQFIFVDDGSSDDTAGRLEVLIAQAGPGNIELLRCTPNGGKGQAIKRGLDVCQAPKVCFTDGDLAYPLKSLDTLANSLQTHQVVIGSRHLDGTRQHNISLHRKFLGWGFNKLVRVILALPYRDTQAGLKGFDLDAARHIFDQLSVTGFAFDAEIIFLAQRLGYSIGQIPAIVSQAHSYKISTMNMWRDPLKMLLSVSRVRLNAWRGKYGQANPAQFRRGRVRHSAGVQSPPAARSADGDGSPRPTDSLKTARTTQYPIHIVHHSPLRRPSSCARQAGRTRA